MIVLLRIIAGIAFLAYLTKHPRYFQVGLKKSELHLIQPKREIPVSYLRSLTFTPGQETRMYSYKILGRRFTFGLPAHSYHGSKVIGACEEGSS
jgi:hypothetical protein